MNILDNFQNLATSGIVYLDNAATTWQLDKSLEEYINFEKRYRSNVHRSVHSLAIAASSEYENTRHVAQKFLNAEYCDEIIFTSGTTHGINLIAYNFGLRHKNHGRILVTMFEHHSNILPWKNHSHVIPYISDDPYEIDLNKWEHECRTSKVEMAAITMLSNVTGYAPPIKEMIEIAHKYNIQVVIDAAQAASKLTIDVKELNCDYLVLSIHKVYGPMGVGLLYAKREHLQHMQPYMPGGGSIISVDWDKIVWNNSPSKFESGTSNIPGIIASGHALNWFMANRHEHSDKVSIIRDRLMNFSSLQVWSAPVPLGSIIFNFKSAPALDIATLLSSREIAVRSGSFCAQPYMKELGVNSAVRVSTGIYTTDDDIDKFLDGVRDGVRIFG